MILKVRLANGTPAMTGQQLPSWVLHRRGVVTAVDAESRMPGRSALADPSKGEDGVNWFRWVWFWPAFDWLKSPQEVLLAVRD